MRSMREDALRQGRCAALARSHWLRSRIAHLTPSPASYGLPGSAEHSHDVVHALLLGMDRLSCLEPSALIAACEKYELWRLRFSTTSVKKSSNGHAVVALVIPNDGESEVGVDAHGVPEASSAPVVLNKLRGPGGVRGLAEPSDAVGERSTCVLDRTHLAQVAQWARSRPLSGGLEIRCITSRGVRFFDADEAMDARTSLRQHRPTARQHSCAPVALSVVWRQDAPSLPHRPCVDAARYRLSPLDLGLSMAVSLV